MPFNRFLLLALLTFTVNVDANLMDDLLSDEVIQSDPNSLAYTSWLQGYCLGIENSEVEGIVEGVFKRSRIKPVDLGAKPLFLAINVTCAFAQSSQVAAVFVDVKFGYFTASSYPVHYAKPFGSVHLSTTKEQVASSIKSAIERAITFYIEANFDV